MYTDKRKILFAIFMLAIAVVTLIGIINGYRAPYNFILLALSVFFAVASLRKARF